MTVRTLHYDFETRATVDIKLGVHKYAEHPATKVLCLAYAFGDEPPRIWRPLCGDVFPQEVMDHVARGGRRVAHNEAFDRTIWNVVLRRELPHLPIAKIEHGDCTMVRAQVLGLPGGLDMVCKALKLPVTKDLEGYKVMMKLCKPQKIGGELVWLNDPELFERLYAYCLRDIEAEAPVDKLLPPLSDVERELWHMSERINDRGIAIDQDNVRRAAEVVDAEGKALSLAVSQLTRGQATATQRGKLLAWLDNHGLELPDMKKHTIRDATKGDMPTEAIAQVLKLQTEANKTSTAKLKKMANRVCNDGRVRGEYRFAGASTLRWSSNGIQLHNFARPDKGFKLDDAVNCFEWLAYPPQHARTAIRREYGSVMFAMSHSLRPLLIAGPGKELICADYSNIEGRVLAWLAGEEWKLDAFREYDAGTGPDLYKLAFAKAFGVPADSVDDDQRQVGKVIELSLQYQSGHGGFLAMAAGYDADIKRVAEVVHANTPADEWRKFSEMYDAKGAPHFNLERYEWTAIKALVTKWRNANSSIRTFWYELEEAAIAAVAEPGKVTGVRGLVHFQVADNFLWVRSPSGSRLAYAYPSLGEIDTPWGVTKPSIRVWGTEKGAWMPYHLYGGLLAENCIAGGACVLTDAGYKRLDAVSDSDLIWDGVDFVAHEGLLDKGAQDTIELDGVPMTADHGVLTEKGWRSASSCEGFNRAPVWAPKGYRVRGIERAEIVMASPLRLRSRKDICSQRASERENKFVRVPAKVDGVRTAANTWDGETPGFCCVGFNDSKVQFSISSGLEKLWRAGHKSMSAMARKFRGLLVGYGSELRSWLGHRAHRQQFRLRARKLSLGVYERPGPKQTQQYSDSDSVGAHYGSGSVGEKPHRCDYDIVPPASGLASEPFTSAPGQRQRVYDLKNCGPRHRFVVFGLSGPFVVHNCTQHVARNILALAMLRLESAGYPIVLHTHDECAAEVAKGSGSLDEYTAIMCELPAWAQGLPVSVAGWRGERYRKA